MDRKDEAMARYRECREAMACYRARNLGSDLRVFALTVSALVVALIGALATVAR